MEWYYAKHGKQEGPLDQAALQSKLQSGEVAPTDLVWREGMPEWKAAGEIGELTAVPQAAATPGIQPPGQGMTPGQVAGSPMGSPAYQPQIGNIVPTDGLAIASLVCGILSLIMCYVNIVAAIPAIICGHMSLKKIRNSPVPLAGRGMAIAGLITGYIGLSVQVLIIAAIVVGTAVNSF